MFTKNQIKSTFNRLGKGFTSFSAAIVGVMVATAFVSPTTAILIGYTTIGGALAAALIKEKSYRKSEDKDAYLEKMQNMSLLDKYKNLNDDINQNFKKTPIVPYVLKYALPVTMFGAFLATPTVSTFGLMMVAGACSYAGIGAGLHLSATHGRELFTPSEKQKTPAGPK